MPIRCPRFTLAQLLSLVALAGLGLALLSSAVSIALEMGPRGLLFQGLQVAISDDGKLVACGKRSGSIELWSVADDERRAAPAHRGRVNYLAFSPDGKMLATAGDDGIVNVFNAADLRVLCSLERHDGGARAIAFAPDGQTLATGGRDGMVRLWDAGSGKLLAQQQAHDDVCRLAFSPDGRLLASGSPRYSIAVWDARDLKNRARFDGSANYLHVLAILPDGKTLLAASRPDNAATLWDISLGKPIRSFTAAGANRMGASNGAMLACGGWPDSLRLWSTTNGQLLADISTSAGHEPPSLILRDQENGAAPFNLAVTPDGRTIATASYDDTIEIWDVGGETRRGVYYPRDDRIAAWGWRLGALTLCLAALVVFWRKRKTKDPQRISNLPPALAGSDPV